MPTVRAGSLKIRLLRRPVVTLSGGLFAQTFSNGRRGYVFPAPAAFVKMSAGAGTVEEPLNHLELGGRDVVGLHYRVRPAACLLPSHGRRVMPVKWRLQHIPLDNIPAAVKQSFKLGFLCGRPVPVVPCTDSPIFFVRL